MSAPQQFDRDNSAKVEKLYLTADVAAQRAQTLEALQLRAGERVLDIGAGPGLLARAMAVVVGAGGRVCGIDASAHMLALAQQRCSDLPWTEFHKADAAILPYPDGTFDAAVSTQVYEYVVDVAAALAELYRVVRPGGRALVVDTDYDSLVIHTRDQARMQRMLTAWDRHFVHRDLPRTLSLRLRECGFILRRRAAVPMFNAEYDDDTFAKGLLAIMAAYAVGAGAVSAQEADAWLAEFAALGKEGSFFFSLNRYLFVAEKPA